MNQILTVEKQNNVNNNNNGSSNMKKILRIMAIILVIVAIIAIALAAYAILKKGQPSTKVNEKIEPKIYVKAEGIDTVKISVKHDKGIKELIYSWNEENEQTIDGNNSQEIEEVVEIPDGSNTLYIMVIDINGNKSDQFKQDFENNGMRIAFDSVNDNVRITVESKTEITYLTYRWDEQEEKRVEVNDTKIETEVQTLKGTHTITVVAVDENNKSVSATKIVVGATKPVINVSIEDDKYYVINVTDENEIKKVEILTPEGTETKEPLDKEFEYKVELKHGDDNKMIIRAYNANEKAMAEKKVKYTLE